MIQVAPEATFNKVLAHIASGRVVSFPCNKKYECRYFSNPVMIIHAKAATNLSL